MKRAVLRAQGKEGLELIEEACVTLRHCPPGILMLYMIGAVPFLSALLVFWSSACHDPLARDHLAEWALAVAVLFVWMKVFQARFGAALLAHLGGAEPPQWTVTALLRSVANQTVFAALGLVLLPIAALIALPFGWVYAFFQNISARDSGESGLRALYRDARTQAALWPTQNHLVLLILSTFGFVLYLNWASLLFVIPALLRMFFGIESIFTQSPMAILNTTSLAFLAALTYLTLDPLLKTCYILRCFHGESLGTGADLRVDLRRLSGLARAAVLAALFVVALPGARAEEPAGPVTAESLDTAISRVAEDGKYAWRHPVEPSAKKKDGPILGFLRKIWLAIRGFIEWIGDLIERLIEWLCGRKDRPPSEDSPGWMTPQLGLLYLVLAVVAALLAVALLRFFKNRRRPVTASAEVLPVLPDLRRDDPAADALPEDEWLRLGQSLLEQGEFRLALRAFYLASLAHLASRGLVTIARHKSNREYERELRRRAHAIPGLEHTFADSVRVIDGVWYGRHEAGADTVRAFVENFHRLRAAA